MEVNLLVVLLILGSVLYVVSFCLAVYAVIIVKSMEKSTHQVTYMPVNNEKSVSRDLNADFEIAQ